MIKQLPVFLPSFLVLTFQSRIRLALRLRLTERNQKIFACSANAVVYYYQTAMILTVGAGPCDFNLS